MSDKIELLKKMAMADGVLSENEKNVFRETLDLSESDMQILFEQIESELESVQSETELIDWKHKNGLDFEKYIVKLLPDDYKNLRWTGDKYVDGRYDESSKQPDVIFDIELNKVYSVAIECKFRMSYFKELLFVARKEQLDRYREFQEKSDIPVFLAIGVGGSGIHPEELFVVPLNAIKFPVVKKSYLKKFQKKLDQKLFYHVKSKSLY
jgi:hypothetical protein